MQTASVQESARLQAYARAVAESDLDAAREAAAARLAAHTEFFEILQREKANRAETLANLQAAGIDPKDATACDWFRAGRNIKPCTEGFTPLWWEAICTLHPDKAIQSTSASIEEETLFIAAIDRQQRIMAEAGRICPGIITQTAPRFKAADALLRAEAIIDAQDGIPGPRFPRLSLS
jgi:hypothetical protein